MTTSTALYLVFELDPSTMADADARITAALAAGGAASALLRAADFSALSASDLKRLIERIQAAGVAAMIADDASLARTLRADGVHLSFAKDQLGRLTAAREILGTRFMIGVEAGRSRHDAMSFGEAAADYISFGIPPHVEDRDTALERQLDLVSWWCEIFEVPCVAFDVPSVDAAARLAAARADFVAVTIAHNADPKDAAARVAAFAAALELTPEPA